MSIDKFGRHASSTAEKKSPSHKLFFLTPGGDYDANGKIIHNLGNPKSSSDAITKGYLEENTITKGNNTNYDAKQKLIRNVEQPLLADDVVTKRYLERETLTKNKIGHYDAREKCIVNLRKPSFPADAANKEFVDSKTIATTSDGDYDLKYKRLRYCADPDLPNDAVTLQYVEKLTPHSFVDHWDFSGKKLSNIGDAVYDGEAVNIRTLKKMAPGLKMGNTINAANLKISQLADATTDTDATNLRVVRFEIEKTNKLRDEQLSRFGSALFNYIHRAARSASDPNINKDNFLDWEQIKNNKQSTEKTN